MRFTLQSCLVVLASTAVMAVPRNIAPRAKWNGRPKYTESVSNYPVPTCTSPMGAAPTVALNATAPNCFITVPNNPLSAEGLATPYLLQPPCSMAVNAQQAFAEATVYDPATGALSVYHPLVMNAGTTPAQPNVVPQLPANAVVGLWFGFNGVVLQLIDANGQNTNTSPMLKGSDCVNGLPGVNGDVFGQVSWCNAQPFFAAVNKGIAAGLTVIPPLGNDNLGNACPTSRSFEITDACPSDNVPTKYLLNPTTLQTAQDTAANRALMPAATELDNASDEALLSNIIDPLIGCTPFQAPSLDDPGVMSSALALSEIQAATLQAAPIGLVPVNDPDCLTTADGVVSADKTNAYRVGVNQGILSGSLTATVDPTGLTGALVPYCNNMVTVAPPFLAGFQNVFINKASPAANVGTNLFTFLCERYLMSLTQLTCPPAAFQPVVCQVDANTGAATSCVITLNNTLTVTGGTNATMNKFPPTTSVAPSSCILPSIAPTGSNMQMHKHRKHKA